ncbi:MAG: phosphatase PAP2 family protein [Kofleriaceae bacterium]
MPRSVLLNLALAIALPRTAAADEPSSLKTFGWTDGAITLGAGLAAVAFTRIPVDSERLWKREAFGRVDRSTRGQFSAKASALSDLLLVTSLTAPMFSELGGIDDDSGGHFLIYGEALAATLVLNAGTKYLVQRPRPYAYHEDSRVAAWAREQGKDSRLSFYSGHAALAFTGATTGGYLFATTSDNINARTAMWASGAMLASATAIMRVRAGKHYYSDVLTGAVLGVAVGYAVPRLHDDGGIMLTGREWLGIGGGIAVGALAALIVPLPGDVAMQLRPLVLESGGGVAFGGAIR